MKWLLIVIGVIVGIFVIVYLIGLSLPRNHSAQVREVIPANIEKVWHRVTTVSEFASWRNDMTTTEIGNDSQWVEVAGRMRIPMKITEREPMKRMVTVINSSDLPFGGEWVYVLQPQGDSTVLTITEDGEVRAPVFRFVSAFVMGHTATLKKYMAALKQSLSK
jgi:hypothetical protein